MKELPDETCDAWLRRSNAMFEQKPLALRPSTDEDKASVAHYGADLAGRMSMMLGAIDELKRRAAELCEVARVLHLRQVGKRTTDDVHAAILAWGRANEICAGWSCAECGLHYAPGTDGAIAARKLGAARCIPCGGGGPK
jgi:hypothetical protein